MVPICGDAQLDRRPKVFSAAVTPISPLNAGLPGACSALDVRREWFQHNALEILKTHTRFFISSLDCQSKAFHRCDPPTLECRKRQSLQARQGVWQ
jgi:hypothetical protein